MYTVKVGDAAVHSVNTVAVVVAPVGNFAARYREIDGIKCRACLTVKEGHILRTVKDIAVTVAVVLAAVSDDFTLAVFGAVGGLGDEFGFAVTVEISNTHLRIVLTCADILAQIDTP